MQSAIASRIQEARIAAGYRTPEAAAIELALHPEVFGVTSGWILTGVGLGPKC